MRLSAAVLSCLCALAILSPAAAKDAPPLVDPTIGRVEVTLDLPKDKPYVGEMIMLRMRSFVRADVVRDEIRQPPLLNFSWQQLGRDKPIEAMIDGFRVAGLERDIAIFPDTSGRLIIEPFDRHVTIVTSDNRRVDADFTSKPVYVDVQNYTAVVGPDQWWLPAKSLTISDSWSQVPDEIKQGTLSTRTMVVEAAGLTADRLPPAPEMLAPGTIAFRGPVERQTLLTDDGPVARGTYQWNLRPVSASPAQMPAIHIPWFDTQERRMRDAALPSVWIAYLGTLVHPSHEKIREIGLFSPGPLLLGAAGFLWTLVCAGLLLTSRQPLGRAARRRRRALAALSRAGRFRDGAGFANALVELGRADPIRWAGVCAKPDIARELARLDAARFGRGAPDQRPDLKRLAVDIRRAWNASAPEATARPTLLPELDAPLAKAGQAAPVAGRLMRRG